MNLGGPKEQQTAQSSADDIKGQLDKKGYTDPDKPLPPTVSPRENWTEEMNAEYARAINAKADQFVKQGIPLEEAHQRALEDPEVKAVRAKLIERALQTPTSPYMEELLKR